MMETTKAERKGLKLGRMSADHWGETKVETKGRMSAAWMADMTVAKLADWTASLLAVQTASLWAAQKALWSAVSMVDSLAHQLAD